MASIDLTFRGVPAWLLRDYLVEMGGTRDGDAVTGDGWRIHFTSGRFAIGGLSVGEVTVHLTGDTAVIQPLSDVIRRKAMRGGG